MGFAGGYNAGGMVGTGGGMGGMLAAQAMYMAGANMEGWKGTALEVGSSFAPNMVDFAAQAAASTNAGQHVAGLLKGGALTFGSLSAGGMSAGVAAGGLIAGSAALGVGVGVGINKLRAAKGNNMVLSAAQQAQEGDIRQINGMFNNGKSKEEIEKYIKKQISVLDSQRKEVTGKAHWLAGEGDQRSGLEAFENQMKEILNSLPEKIALREQNQKEEQAAQQAVQAQQEFQTKLLAALTALAGGNDNSSNKNIAMKVDLSVTDTNSIPIEIKEKFIYPLMKQLKDLETNVNMLMNKVSPQPAKV